MSWWVPWHWGDLGSSSVTFKLYHVPGPLWGYIPSARFLAGRAGDERAERSRGAWPVTGTQQADVTSCASVVAPPDGLKIGFPVAQFSDPSPPPDPSIFIIHPHLPFPLCFFPSLNDLVFSPHPRVTREEAHSHLVCNSMCQTVLGAV